MKFVTADLHLSLRASKPRPSGWGRLLTLEEAYNMTGALPVWNKHC